MGDYRELRVVITIIAEEDNLLAEEKKGTMIAGTRTLYYPETATPLQLMCEIKQKIEEIEESSLP